MTDASRPARSQRRKLTTEYQIGAPVLPEVFGAYERLVATLKTRGVVRVDGDKLNKGLMLSTVILMLEDLPVERLEQAMLPAARKLEGLLYVPEAGEPSGVADLLLGGESPTAEPPRQARVLAEIRRPAEIKPAPRKKKPGRTRG